jgi:hypothetical protein
MGAMSTVDLLLPVLVLATYVGGLYDWVREDEGRLRAILGESKGHRAKRLQHEAEKRDKLAAALLADSKLDATYS